jgi:hypothetical protein
MQSTTENVIPALAVNLLRKLSLMSFPVLLKGPQKTASGPYLPYRLILVISTIIHGITMWVRHQTEEDLRVHAPTVGSLRGPDVLLTAAFTEQFQSIGWYHFLLGRLSSYWGKEAAAYAKTKDPSYPKVWMAQFISIVWKYSRSLWSYRNSIVHGAMDAKSLYNTFRTSPHFILTHHQYLFTCRSLEQCM